MALQESDEQHFLALPPGDEYGNVPCVNANAGTLITQDDCLVEGGSMATQDPKEPPRDRIKRHAREIRDAFQLFMEYVHEEGEAFDPNIAISLLDKAENTLQRYANPITYACMELFPPGTVHQHLRNAPPDEALPKKPRG